MVIIAGLGNPGTKYAKTRHNVGFRVLDLLSEEHRITLQGKDLYELGKGMIEAQESILLKPLTFMNRSGLALKKLLKKRSLLPEELQNRLIVVHDDLDLETGTIRIRRNGSSGGHKGVESIINELGTKDFIRVKIGIGREGDIPAEEYVLSSFKAPERDLIREAIAKAAQAVVVIMTEGVDKAMNKFNRSARLLESPLEKP